MTSKRTLQLYRLHQTIAHLIESRDVLNRPQFEILTWQGEDTEKQSFGDEGGWWHGASIILDPYDGVTLYEDVRWPVGFDKGPRVGLKEIAKKLSAEEYQNALGEESTLDLLLEVAGPKLKLARLDQREAVQGGLIGSNELKSATKELRKVLKARRK
jgi:hypothetical protein